MNSFPPEYTWAYSFHSTRKTRSFPIPKITPNTSQHVLSHRLIQPWENRAQVSLKRHAHCPCSLKKKPYDLYAVEILNASNFEKENENVTSLFRDCLGIFKKRVLKLYGSLRYRSGKGDDDPKAPHLVRTLLVHAQLKQIFCQNVRGKVCQQPADDRWLSWALYGFLQPHYWRP